VPRFLSVHEFRAFTFASTEEAENLREKPQKVLVADGQFNSLPSLDSVIADAFGQVGGGIF
jgi:hypothetical protein